MKIVLEYGEDYPGCIGVVPPSPNSSSDSLAKQNAILEAHRMFQKNQLIRPGSPVVPVRPDAAHESAGASVASGASADGGASVGQASVASSSDSASSDDSLGLSLLFPDDNPGPESIVGGHNPLSAFLELGNVQFNQSVVDWFKLSTVPTEFKLVAGPDGREFLFCVPDADGIEVERVEPTGHRTVGLQVVGLPRSQVAGVQVALGVEDLASRRAIVDAQDGAPIVVGDPVDAGVVDMPSLEGTPAGSNVESASSGNDTTVSSATAEKERQELLATVELTK